MLNKTKRIMGLFTKWEYIQEIIHSLPTMTAVFMDKLEMENGGKVVEVITVVYILRSKKVITETILIQITIK